MKIICKQENLINGLQKVSHLSGKNFNLPILNNILINVDGGNIELMSTNLEMGVKTSVRGKIESEGKITVPAKIFTDYINLISSDKNINIEVENNDILINSDDWQTKIKGNPAEDYPLIPEVKEKNKIKIKINDFKKIINQVVFAASFDETRPELSGVLFWLSDTKLFLTATDSYRLAEKKINLEDTSNRDEKYIVPLKTMQELIRIISDLNEGEVSVFFDENQIKFTFNETIIISRLIEGEYPDYKQIIPLNFNTQTEVEVGELIKAIKASSLFAKTGVFDINLNFLKNGLVINSINNQLGENTIKLKTSNFQGNEVSVVFNYKYLLDGLNNFNYQNIKVAINSATNPVLFKPITQEEYLYLVMPIRQ